MRVRFVFAVLIVGALLCLVCAPQASAQSAGAMKTVKIGVISPQSGPVAFSGIGVLRGVEIAVKNINEKGTSGKGPGGILVGNQRYKIEVVSYDDAADPAKSVAGMRRLAELHKVPVTVGPFGTPQAWACMEVNVQLGVLMDGMSASDQSRRKGNPLYIQERIPTIYFGDPMAQACIERGYKKAAIVTDVVEAYATHGKRFKEKFESLGGQVVAFEMVDVKHTTDFHSVMTSIKAKNPDVLFITAYEEPVALAATHALDVGYKGKFLLTTDFGVKAEKIVGLDKVEGALTHSFVTTYYRKYPAEDKRGHFTNFLKQYTQTYKEDISVPGISSHDPTYMFARAMEISGSVTDARAIRAACPKALQERTMPLIFQNVDVLKNGLMWGAPDVLLEIKGGQYKFVRELGVAREVLE
jgi:branched-chain amino acid transport system substrate-binding protein